MHFNIILLFSPVCQGIYSFLTGYFYALSVSPYVLVSCAARFLDAVAITTVVKSVLQTAKEFS
jgi:hypothetical protein